jgi:predicted glutamine amidotransferase
MCRFIFWMGAVDTAAAFEGMRRMSLSRNERHERSLQGALHDSGWGVAYRAEGRFRLHHSTVPFFNDIGRLRLMDVQTDLLMLHARKASKGPVSLENCHPFRHEGNLFMHNGSIEHFERLPLARGLKPRGTTDSERLFLHILGHVDWSRDLDSLADCLAKMTGYTALNFVLYTPGAVYASCAHTAAPGYYTMKVLLDDKKAIISSERIPGIEGPWRELPNRTLIRITSEGKVEERQF